MNIHEYQAKELLRSYGLPVLRGIVYNQNNIETISIKNLNGPPWIVKSQIHAGGRGEGYFFGFSKDKGGVRLANNIEEVKKEASFMFGKKLITKQTGPEGKVVNTVYIEEGCQIKKELYLSILIDRKFAKIMLMVSESGGMNIEEIAIKTPDKILTHHFEKLNQNNDEGLMKIADKLNVPVALKRRIIPLSKATSPILVVTKAFLAASAAERFS